MILPQQIHFFDGNLFSFWQQEENEAAHNYNQSSEQQEDSVPEMAHSCKETLRYQSREKHVDTHHHTLPG